MTYSSPIDLVRTFHETFGHAIRTEPALDIPERKLRVELVREEAEEYATADREDDFVEVVDALGDIVYVVCGAALAHGLDISKETLAAQAELHQKLEEGKSVLDIADRHYWVDRMDVAFRAYAAAEAADDLNGIREALALLNTVAYRASLAHGVDLDRVLDEIQSSNMSKLGADGKPILRADGKILKGPNYFTPTAGIHQILRDGGVDLTV